MTQQTLAMAQDGFEQYRKPTRRDQFLDTMDQILPWEALCAMVEPVYPKPVPDATSLLRFRHLLEQHQFGEKLFAQAGRVLQDSGMTLKTGTIVDATLIAAPFSFIERGCLQHHRKLVFRGPSLGGPSHLPAPAFPDSSIDAAKYRESAQ